MTKSLTRSSWFWFFSKYDRNSNILVFVLSFIQPGSSEKRRGSVWMAVLWSASTCEGGLDLQVYPGLRPWIQLPNLHLPPESRKLSVCIGRFLVLLPGCVGGCGWLCINFVWEDKIKGEIRFVVSVISSLFDNHTVFDKVMTYANSFFLFFFVFW